MRLWGRRTGLPRSQEDFEGNEYVHYIDYDDAFTSIDMQKFTMFNTLKNAVCYTAVIP